MVDSGHFVREVEGVHHLKRARWVGKWEVGKFCYFLRRWTF
jgi:hypothetical protein